MTAITPEQLQRYVAALDRIADQIATTFQENPSVNVIPILRHIADVMAEDHHPPAAIEYVMRRVMG